MRDPNRLDVFYDELKRLHKENVPDWRFGQFLVNFLTWYNRDPFYLEEDKMMEEISRYFDSIKMK